MVHGVFPRDDGGYDVRLAAEERALLRALARELAELVADEHGSTTRLFPPAFRDDPVAEEEYRRLAHGSLVSGRLEALRQLETGAGATEIGHDEAEAWCGALNDLRLVLGEQLGITEELYEQGIDPDDPNVAALSEYLWLTWLQADVVEALSSRL